MSPQLRLPTSLLQKLECIILTSNKVRHPLMKVGFIRDHQFSILCRKMSKKK